MFPLSLVEDSTGPIATSPCNQYRKNRIFPATAQVWRVGWWMAHYSSQTPKRHFAYSNSRHVLRVDKGVLQWKNGVNREKAPKTVVHYKSKSGKSCYKGTSALKKTETLGFQSCIWLFLILGCFLCMSQPWGILTHIYSNVLCLWFPYSKKWMPYHLKFCPTFKNETIINYITQFSGRLQPFVDTGLFHEGPCEKGFWIWKFWNLYCITKGIWFAHGKSPTATSKSLGWALYLFRNTAASIFPKWFEYISIELVTALVLELREYTVQFGRCICDLWEDMTATACGIPDLPFSCRPPPAQMSYQHMSEEGFDLGYAKLQEVFNYLRRGRHLVIPDDWAHLIPKPGPWVSLFAFTVTSVAQWKKIGIAWKCGKAFLYYVYTNGIYNPPNWKTKVFKFDFHADPHAMTIFMDYHNHVDYFLGQLLVRKPLLEQVCKHFWSFLWKIMPKMVMGWQPVE